MTELHSNVKIHLVDALFVGNEYRTDVWISEHAREALKKAKKRHRREIDILLGKVSHWAKAGFTEFVGKKAPIKPEGQGVLRLGDTSSLFRGLGFFDGDNFIWIDFIFKRGRRLSDADRDAVSEVARVKKLRAWKFNDEPE